MENLISEGTSPEPMSPQRHTPASPPDPILDSPSSEMQSSISRAQEIDRQVIHDSQRIRSEAEQFLKDEELGKEEEFETQKLFLPSYDSHDIPELDLKLHTKGDTKTKDYYKEITHMKSIILGLSEKLHINMVHRDEVEVLRGQLAESQDARLELQASIDETTDQLRKEAFATETKMQNMLKENSAMQDTTNSANSLLHETQDKEKNLTTDVENLNKTITLLKGRIFNFEDMQSFNDKIRNQLQDSEKNRQDVQNSMKRAENEFSSATENQKQLINTLNAQRSQLEDELAKQKAAHNEYAEARTEELSQIRQKANNDLDELRREKAEENADIRAQLQKECEATKQKLLDEIDTVRKTKNGELDALEQQKSKELQQLREKAAADSLKAAKEALAKLDAKQAEMDHIRDELIGELNRCTEIGAQELQLQRTKYQGEADNLRVTSNAAIEMKDKAIEQLKSEHEAEMVKTRKANDEELEKQRNAAKSDQDAAAQHLLDTNKEKDHAYENAKAEHLKEVSNLRKEHDTGLEELRTKMQKEMDALRAKCNEEVEEKELQIEEIRAKNLQEQISFREETEQTMHQMTSKYQNDFEIQRAESLLAISEKQSQIEKLRQEKIETEAKLRKEKDDELEKLRIKMQGEIESTNSICQNVLSRKQQESDRMRADLLEEIKCVRAEKDAELQVLAVSKDSEIDTLSKTTGEEITVLKRKCQTIIETSQSQLHAFKKEKEAEFEAMKLQLNTEISQKQKIFDIEQKGSADAMEALETTKGKEIDNLNTTANKNLSELRAERAAEADKLNKKITDLEQSNSELTAQIVVQTDKDELIEALKDRSDDHENSRKELQTQIDTTCGEFKAQQEESKATQDAVIQDHVALQVELDSVKEDSAAKRDIIHGLEIQNQDMVNNIATLEQLCCMKEDMHIILDQNDKQTASLRSMKDQLLKELNSSSEYIITQSEKSLEENRHYNKMKEVLEDRHYEIEALKQLVVQLRARRPVYQAFKGDRVDQTLGEYINKREEPLMVPLIREDNEIYTFGTKRIFIKLEQGKIIIRVGGGFMQLEEFLEIYTPIELEKQENRLADVHPKQAKVMGKLMSNQLTGQTPMSPQKAASILKKSVELGGLKTSFTTAYAVRRPSPERLRSPTRD